MHWVAASPLFFHPGHVIAQRSTTASQIEQALLFCKYFYRGFVRKLLLFYCRTFFYICPFECEIPIALLVLLYIFFIVSHQEVILSAVPHSLDWSCTHRNRTVAGLGNIVRLARSIDFVHQLFQILIRIHGRCNGALQYL